MLEFVLFDKQRLTAFKNNPLVTNTIDLAYQEGIQLLKFLEVDYFNYAFGSVCYPETLARIQTFFQDRKDRRHKIILKDSDPRANEFLKKRADYVLKESIAYFQSPAREIIPIESGEISLEKVNRKNIGLYTQLYLEVFNAQNNHPISVEENLKLMLDISNFHAYLVRYQDDCIGICSFWLHRNTLLFTAGGLKENYRGMKFHLSTLAARTLLAQQAGIVDSISSWATSNSASSHNLQAFGLTNTHNYNVYEFTGTP